MDCALVSSFIARQGIIAAAAGFFLLYTYVRAKMGLEHRNLKTFVADCSKQGGQQAVGGVLMVVIGVILSQNEGLDALAWYGAEYRRSR